MTLPDPVVEDDLNAFVDDQLDIVRRIEVEAFLAANPSTAARVMADLRSRDTLRLDLTRPSAAPTFRTLDAARRLERALLRMALAHRLRQAAGIAALVAIGWFAHAQTGGLGIGRSEAALPPPAFVEDALAAHRTVLIRAAMHSQPEVTSFDPLEIERMTRVVMPTLPDDWRALDLQVFPSGSGPSVEMAIETAELGRISLFAVHANGFGVIAPTVVRQDEQTTAYWQMGEHAYALTGKADERKLGDAARVLVTSLY